jgi:hypothetical protein
MGLFRMLILSACFVSCAESSNAGADKLIAYAVAKNLLNDVDVKLESALKDKSIYLNSLVIVTHSDEKNMIRLDFKQADLGNNFKKELHLYCSGENGKISHPFFSPGIELIANEVGISLVLHSGTVLYIGNGLPNAPGYTTFSKDSVSGLTRKVVGEVYISSNPVGSEKSRSIMVSWIGKNTLDMNKAKTEVLVDGSIVTETPYSDDVFLPKPYQPKIDCEKINWFSSNSPARL